MPSRPTIGRRLVTSLYDRGGLLTKAGDDEEALHSYQRAVACQRLVQAFRGDPQMKTDLAELHHDLGVRLANLKRPKEATDALNTAATIWREVGGADECFRAAKCYARCALLVSHDGQAASRKQFAAVTLVTLRQWSVPGSRTVML